MDEDAVSAVSYNEIKSKKSKATQATKMKPAFGSGLPRFPKFTGHPDLDRTGLFMARPDGCDPCLYHPISIHTVFKVNKNLDTKDPWRYKNELEEWSKNLGYRNQKQLQLRRWQSTLGGPAWTTVPDPPKCDSPCKNVGFGRTPRFKYLKGNANPGPGTYYSSTPYKVPYGPHSTRPTFEREDPCRFRDTSAKWSLAPNRYTIVDKDCIAEKPNKIVSLKGPYMLFTGKRDASTIYNHFRTNRCRAATWPLALPGSFERFKKLPVGRMNKTGRDVPCRNRIILTDLAMCPRKPSEPGPAHYRVWPPREFKQNKYGFNSSYDRGPGYQRVVVWPGVGRYKVRTIACGGCSIPGKGHKHVFKSKDKRTVGAFIQEPMNSF